MPVFIVACITWGIYSLFELFVHRKERLILLDKIDFSKGDKDINLNIFNPKSRIGNNALRIGFLLMGVGLGLLIGFIVYLSNLESINELTVNHHWRYHNEIKTTIYCACVLLFGGAGLLTAYLIERKQIKQSK